MTGTNKQGLQCPVATLDLRQGLQWFYFKVFQPKWQNYTLVFFTVMQQVVKKVFLCRYFVTLLSTHKMQRTMQNIVFQIFLRQTAQSARCWILHNTFKLHVVKGCKCPKEGTQFWQMASIIIASVGTSWNRRTQTMLCTSGSTFI